MTAPSQRRADAVRVEAILDSPASDRLADRYAQVRARTGALAAPLSAEDAMVQSMPDASPAKWHLAHTTWFFEQFVLGARPGYRPLHPEWAYLFNSYYQGVGPMHPRPKRGLLSRPSLDAVRAWRETVDARVDAALARGDCDVAMLQALELGLQHEQQHQELLLTDLQHALWSNPLQPAYRDDLPPPPAPASALQWQRFDEAMIEIGAPGWPAPNDAAPAPFAYDNESPRHRVLSPAFALATRPVSNDEYRGFIADGGYRTPALWLSDGWALLQEQGWQRPLYWRDDLTHAYTLGGVRALAPHAPVAHLSLYEADAFARWAGARLPTEAEWERAAAGRVPQADDNFVEAGLLQPRGNAGTGMRQLFGDVWEWTASAYLPYPGFRPWTGTVGEYNGKFMSGQCVLRGGSCASPRGHLRASYRNFFQPSARWQFAGLRLSRDAA
ncbi:MAG: ergothioneine biosynthesis protein EgtB [Lysobacter sp.]|nr:ergothioneine biosynthesis protein EgtB [Lysobacter sp.]